MQDQMKINYLKHIFLLTHSYFIKSVSKIISIYFSSPNGEFLFTIIIIILHNSIIEGCDKVYFLAATFQFTTSPSSSHNHVLVLLPSLIRLTGN